MTQNETIIQVDRSDLEATAIDVLSMFERFGFDWIETGRDSDYELFASIGILVPGTPVVAIGADRKFARELAVSYFGEEEGADESTWPEAVQELTNVMGGAVKTLLEHEDAPLALPEPGDWPNAHGTRVDLESPVGRLAVGFFSNHGSE